MATSDGRANRTLVFTAEGFEKSREHAIPVFTWVAIKAVAVGRGTGFHVVGGNLVRRGNGWNCTVLARLAVDLCLLFRDGEGIVGFRNGSAFLGRVGRDWVPPDLRSNMKERTKDAPEDHLYLA